MLTIMIAVATAGGCIEREMTITSTPPGAIVYISDVEKGRTPVTVEFTWYGDYDIILRHDGYETLKTHAQINPPVYAIPPFDLLSTIAPWTYRDRRYLHFEMRRFVESSSPKLIGRADAMAQRNREPVGR